MQTIDNIYLPHLKGVSQQLLNFYVETSVSTCSRTILSSYCNYK
nr:MAG TPA: hypothetical protein [Bacteriophage sp.]